jgi:predicted nuclease of predicted toxin-antitoxin system
MSCPLLLDEMLSGTIAEHLRAKGHDVLAVADDPALISLPDDQIFARATAAGRALVTANIKDFMPLDAQYRAAGRTHAGLILVSTKTVAQDRTYTAAIASALAALLDEPDRVQAGHVLFLTRQ